MPLDALGVLLTTEGSSPAVLEETVRGLVEQGLHSVWLPEHFGREVFVTAAVLLSALPALQVHACDIALDTRAPEILAMAQQTLVELSGGRFVLGLGAHAAEDDSIARAKHLRTGFALLHAAHTRISLKHCLALEGHDPQPVDVAAHGTLRADVGELPVMLTATCPATRAVALDLAQGLFDPLATVTTLAAARAEVGAGFPIAVLQRVCLVSDARRARALGRHVLAHVLADARHRTSLSACGWQTDDFALGGSDALIDSLMAWGDAEALRTRITELRAAGASQVVVQAIDPEAPARPCLRALAALQG